MKHLLLFFTALALGFVSAMPIGGSQIETAKRAIAGHLRAAFAVVLGSVTSDIIYGIIALFGIAPFMQKPLVQVAFNIFGAGILWILAYLTYRESLRPHEDILQKAHMSRKRLSFIVGFSLAFSNPPMILVWLMGISIAQGLNLANPPDNLSNAIFIAGGAIGLGGYLALLAVILYRIKHFFASRSLARIYFWLAIALFVASFYFVFGAWKFFSMKP